MPSRPSPPLGSPSQPGVPRLTHNPLKVGDLYVWFRMDATLANFARPNFGDAFPGGGYVDPSTGNTLYANYKVLTIREVDWQYIDVCYVVLPGPILEGDTIDPVTKIVYPYSKQLVASGTVTAGVTGAGVVHLTIANAGHDFTSNPTLTFTAAPVGGTTATGTAVFSAPGVAGSIGSLTLTNGGLGFTSAPTVAISGGGGSGATATATLTPTTVFSLTLNSTDSSFTDVPTLAFSGGAGAGATGTATLTATSIASVAVDAGGSGYSSATVVAFGGGGTGFAATAHITGNVVTSITVDTPGTGYTSRPILVISGDGAGATAHAVLTGTSIASVHLSGTGSGYTSAPTVAVSGGGGTASVSATLFATTVASLTLTAIGSGYSSPVVAISGGGGSGATATAALNTGTITSVAITNAGAGYLTAPAITVSGGGGSGASILATIGSLTYVEVEPQTADIDLIMRTTVDLASLPAPYTYYGSYRVQRSSISVDGLIINQNTNGVAFGLAEYTQNGGSGPVKAQFTELYMTESAFAAYDPGAFSITGRSISRTLVAEGAVNGTPIVATFRVTPVQEGTSAGVIDFNSERMKYGVRKVTVVSLTQNY